jgi:hypothetical protein
MARAEVTVKTPGQRAYEASHEVTGLAGLLMPRWETLGEPGQERWEHVAAAARAESRPEGSPASAALEVTVALRVSGRELQMLSQAMLDARPYQDVPALAQESLDLTRVLREAVRQLPG